MITLLLLISTLSRKHTLVQISKYTIAYMNSLWHYLILKQSESINYLQINILVYKSVIMKSIYVSLFLLSSFFLNAQENLNRTWFLTELIIDGNSIAIPNEEFQDGYPTISFFIGDPVSEHEGIGICNSFQGMISSTESVINIIDFQSTLIFCDTDEEINFEAMYFNFLGAAENQDFSYDIIYGDSIESAELILIKSNGDQATYSAINRNPSENLTQEGWYLDYFEINGIAQNYPAPQDGQLNNYTITYLGTEAGLSQEYICFYGGGGVYSAFNYFGTSTISVGGFSLLAMDCGIEILNEYDDAFTTQLENKTHTYEIIEEGEGRRLILTDENGDRIFYTNAFLHLEDRTEDISIVLFPNPSQENITVSGDRIDEIQSYQIIDIKGSIISTALFSPTISIQNLTKGLYFIKLKGNKTETVRRFIKN